MVLDGEAIIKRVSVKQQQHYAKDAGKSDEEIKQIKKEKKELQFVAAGVLVLWGVKRESSIVNSEWCQYAEALA